MKRNIYWNNGSFIHTANGRIIDQPDINSDDVITLKTHGSHVINLAVLLALRASDSCYLNESQINQVAPEAWYIYIYKGSFTGWNQMSSGDNFYPNSKVIDLTKSEPEKRTITIDGKTIEISDDSFEALKQQLLD